MGSTTQDRGIKCLEVKSNILNAVTIIKINIVKLRLIIIKVIQQSVMLLQQFKAVPVFDKRIIN